MSNITNWTFKNPTASTYETIVEVPNGKAITIVNLLISNQSGSNSTIKFGFFDNSDDLLSEYFIGDISDNSTGPEEKNMKIFLDQNQKLKIHSTQGDGIYITLSGAITTIDEQNPPESFTWVGEWKSDVNYYTNNLVRHNGTTYIAIIPSKDVEPPNINYWNVFAAAGLVDDHAWNHLSGAEDEIDADRLDIDFSPTNYNPDVSPGEVDSVEHLTSHLKGLDNKVNSSSKIPLITPILCRLDDENIGVSRSSISGIIESIDFNNDTDGSIWFAFHVPQSINNNLDINLELVYNMSGNDDSKQIDMEVKYWTYADGDILDLGSSTFTNNVSIDTGINQDGIKKSYNLSQISSSNANPGNTIVTKITRFGSSDSYSGVLQMIYIYLYQ